MKQRFIILLCVLLIALCVTNYYLVKAVAHKCPEPEPFKVPSIIDVQTGLVNAGYDIGEHGIDGRLADCNTVQAWELYQKDVLFNEYAAVYMTPSGAPRKE